MATRAPPSAAISCTDPRVRSSPVVGPAGWPRAARDRLLMVCPLVWAAGHLFIYIAKVDLFYSVDDDGLSAEGLAVGNPVVAVAAIIAFTAITLVSHPAEGNVKDRAKGR